MSDMYVGESLPNFIRTINGLSPDSAGNVSVAGGWGSLSLLDVIDVTVYPRLGIKRNHYNLRGTTGTFLLPASPDTGDQIECTHLASGAITVDGNGHNIVSSATYTPVADETTTFYYDGTRWSLR